MIRRKWLWRGALLFGATLVALIAVELVLRARYDAFFSGATDYVGLYTLDPDGWTRPRPGHTFTCHLGGRATTVHLNELGLRGAPVPPRGAERRVLVLGDSMVFGVGVEDDETFTALLEPSLGGALGTEVLARSGGAPGFNVFDQARVLDDVRERFDPDLIVSCVFLGNDYKDNFEDKTVVDGFFLAGPVAKVARSSWRMRLALRLRSWFFLEDFLRRKVPPIAIEIPPPAFPAERERGLFLDAIDDDPVIDAVMDKMEEALRAVQTAARGRPLQILLLPGRSRHDLEQYRRDLIARGLDPQRHEFGRGQRRLEQRCDRLGLPVFDLTPSFVARRDSASLFIGDADFHYNRSGHRHVADVVSPILAARLR